MPISAYIAASSVTLIAIIILLFFSPQLRLIDLPSGHKQHEGAVPIVGGIAMYLGLAVGVYNIPSLWHNYTSLMLGSGFLLLVGIIDDIHTLSAKPKLIVQFIAAMLMIKQGVVLHDLGNLIFHGTLRLNYFEIPITIFATIGIINAINMLDGIDGLAGGITLTILISLSILAFINDSQHSLVILLLMVSIVIPFLFFNVGKKMPKIFMGNGGSMFLGYTLVWFLISFSQGENRLAPPITMLCIMALPLFDTWRVMFHRFKSGQSLFHSDRRHIHHIILELGLTHAQISFVLGLLCLICGVISIIVTYYDFPEGLIFMGFIFLFVIYLWLNKFWLNKIQIPDLYSDYKNHVHEANE